MSVILRKYLQVCMDAGSFLGLSFGAFGVPALALYALVRVVFG